jgi:hypothetical protein
VRVYVFSKTRRRAPAGRPRSTGFTVEYLGLDALARTLPMLPAGSLLYLDMAGLTPREQTRRMTLAAEQHGLLFGVIDAAGKVPDPAACFHLGAVDYLGKTLARTGLSARRAADVLAFARASGKLASKDDLGDGLPSARGWADIVEGRQYPFTLLFVEMDDGEEMKKRYQPENLQGAIHTFRSYVERTVCSHGGRVWLWSGFGGVALFPEDNGGSSCFLAALRIIMSRPFFDVEESPLPNALSFRMAISRGQLVYREKKTGGIISDTLNSIFHLGQKYTQRGQLTMTADTLPQVPPGLRDLCVASGGFEGRKILRVRSPLYPAAGREGEWDREG